jgi:hypothetical protein
VDLRLQIDTVEKIERRIWSIMQAQKHYFNLILCDLIINES